MKNTGRTGGQAELLKALEIDQNGFREILRFAECLQIPFFSTPDEEESADFLESLNVPAFKIGSGEVNNLPFLKYVAAKKKPIILSTGMSSLAETAVAVETILSSGCQKLAILHCVSAYPAPFDGLNLRVIPVLEKCFGVPVGFSDHTMGSEAAIAAVALGACIIEKHLTLDLSLPGPDHKCSLLPSQFAVFVKQIRNTEMALGKAEKVAASVEIPTKKVVRKGLAAARNLEVGNCLTPNDIVIKRIGSESISPSDMEKVVGMRLFNPILADEPLTWKHLKP